MNIKLDSERNVVLKMNGVAIVFGLDELAEINRFVDREVYMRKSVENFLQAKVKQGEIFMDALLPRNIESLLNDYAEIMNGMDDQLRHERCLEEAYQKNRDMSLYRSIAKANENIQRVPPVILAFFDPNGLHNQYVPYETVTEATMEIKRYLEHNGGDCRYLNVLFHPRLSDLERKRIGEAIGDYPIHVSFINEAVCRLAR